MKTIVTDTRLWRLFLTSAVIAIIVRTTLTAIQFWIPDVRLILAAGGGSLVALLIFFQQQRGNSIPPTRLWPIWALAGGWVGSEVGAFTGILVRVFYLMVTHQLP